MSASAVVDGQTIGGDYYELSTPFRFDGVCDRVDVGRRFIDVDVHLLQPLEIGFSVWQCGNLSLDDLHIEGMATLIILC